MINPKRNFNQNPNGKMRLIKFETNLVFPYYSLTTQISESHGIFS